MKYRVHYQIATYSGVVEVEADQDDDRDQVIALAEAKLKRLAGDLPAWGARSYRIEESERVPLPRPRWRPSDNAEERDARERAEEEKFDYLKDEGLLRRP